MAKFKFRFSRRVTVTECFDRVIDAPSLDMAKAAAADLAQSSNGDCPDDCREIDGAYDVGTFEVGCIATEGS